MRPRGARLRLSRDLCGDPRFDTIVRSLRLPPASQAWRKKDVRPLGGGASYSYKGDAAPTDARGRPEYVNLKHPPGGSKP